VIVLFGYMSVDNGLSCFKAQMLYLENVDGLILNYTFMPGACDIGNDMTCG
jgi:hypothetical protein